VLELSIVEDLTPFVKKVESQVEKAAASGTFEHSRETPALRLPSSQVAKEQRLQGIPFTVTEHVSLAVTNRTESERPTM
jgi:hypothetical protein